MKLLRHLTTLTVSLLAFVAASASSLPPEQQAKVDAKIAVIKTWVANPVIVTAVATQNGQPPASHTAMTQDQWKKLSVLDPFVRSFNRNEAGALLKSLKAAWVAEAFLSDASGCKVAFLSKPSNWSHGTSAKHTQPMAGQVWQGAVELDESSGLQQIQVGVPVLENGKPIGALVVGISLSALD